jgi:hypothetical protein
MNYYAALEVSLRSVHLCVINDEGEIKAETKLDSEVTDIIAYLDGQERCQGHRPANTRGLVQQGAREEYGKSPGTGVICQS